VAGGDDVEVDRPVGESADAAPVLPAVVTHHPGSGSQLAVDLAHHVAGERHVELVVDVAGVTRRVAGRADGLERADLVAVLHDRHRQVGRGEQEVERPLERPFVVRQRRLCGAGEVLTVGVGYVDRRVEVEVD